jgi:hypothetical protein
MEALLPLLILLIAFALNASNKKKSRQEAKQRYAAKMAKAQKPAAPKAVREKPPVAAEPQEQLTDFGQSDRDGSIDMPAPEPHEHEGKPLPCPAEERQKPVGNPVVLREALSDACYAMFDFLKTQDGPCYRMMTEALDKGKAALASPPRNCDKYTTGKQVEDACADERGCPGCFREDLSSPCVSCTVSWLLATATERKGEGDGS